LATASASGVDTMDLTATGSLGMRVLVTYLFRYSAIFGHTIIWWNGIFGFGTGFILTWSYYLSGRWKRGLPENKK
jgi:Na+-driven multidrug efflux pump